MSKTCYACAHSYIEPDSYYIICGHPESGPLGQFIKFGKPLEHCNGLKFIQHPLRNEDGSLKGK